MKHFTINTFVVTAFVFFGSMSLGFADSSTNMWTCKTNASSATSGSADEQADNDMAKNGKAGNDALAFAYQHCRDCTKITCTKQ